MQLPVSTTETIMSFQDMCTTVRCILVVSITGFITKLMMESFFVT